MLFLVMLNVSNMKFERKKVRNCVGNSIFEENEQTKGVMEQRRLCLRDCSVIQKSNSQYSNVLESYSLSRRLRVSFLNDADFKKC